MPLLMMQIGQSYAIDPLLQPLTFAIKTNHQTAKKIIAFAQVLIPNGNNQGLLIEIMRTGLKAEFLIENRIERSPFDIGFVFFVAMTVRF